MCLFSNREEYTSNPEQWPIVPFGLKAQKDIPDRYKTSYKIGLQETTILGWALGMSEKLTKHGYACPALIWTKELTEDGWVLKTTETEQYYENLSPICSKFRKGCKFFLNACKERDKSIAMEIFKYMDNPDACGKDTIFVRVKRPHVPDFCCLQKTPNESSLGYIDVEVTVVCNDDGTISHFEYTCPCLPLTEIVFPVMCENITIALVMTGQIVEDEKEVIKGIEKLIGKECCAIINIEQVDIRQGDKSEIIEMAKEEINYIEAMYQQQVDSERLYIMDKVVINLDGMLREFDLYGKNNQPQSNRLGLSYLINNATEKEEIGNFFNKCLRMIEEEFGVEHVFLYLDKNLEPETNVAGEFCKKWKESSPNPRDRKSWYENIEGEEGILDLFKDFKGEPPFYYPGLTSDDVCPKGDDWSVFIFENSKFRDDNGEAKELPPFVIGIKYKGGKSGKERYLRAGIQWVSDVLPKFAVFARNVMLAFEIHKHVDKILEGKITLDHEAGQIYDGIQGQHEVFRIRLNDYKKGRITDAEFDKYVKFYIGDIDGQFKRIQMTSKIYGEKPTPKPEAFDIAEEFLSRWEYSFTYQCRVENKWPIISYPKKESKDRQMFTDPGFIEHAVYNVVNNAIKYSYINTYIHVGLKKEGDSHIITVRCYGNYLPENDDSIYERYVRYVHGQGVRNKDDVKAISEWRVAGEVDGMGMGLHSTKKLLDAVGGKISHTCELISQYNVPLMWTFMERYKSKEMFKKLWDLRNGELPYDDIKADYDLLIKNSTYDEIVNRADYSLLKIIPGDALACQLQEKTYAVTFRIEIPTYKEGKNG